MHMETSFMLNCDWLQIEGIGSIIDHVVKANLHSYKRQLLFFTMTSISMHILLWMKVMLDFINMGLTELVLTGIKRKIQN